MANEIVQDIPTQGQIMTQYFTMVYRESPLAKPVKHQVPVGCSVKDIKDKSPKGDFQLIVAKGAEILNDDYIVQVEDTIDVTLVPATGLEAGTIALIISLTTLAVAGYMLYTQEDMAGDEVGDKEQRIKGLRNRERMYESVPVILGKRKIAPMFWARPWTEFVGEEEYFNIMLSAGYGPLKLTNFRIGEVPLSEYEHEIGVLDYYGYNDKQAVRKLWQNDIVQNNVELELVQNSGWSTRNTAANPDYVSVEFNFPAGVYRTNDKGKPRWRHSCVQYQYQLNGDWYTVTRLTNDGAEYTVYKDGDKYRLRGFANFMNDITPYFDRQEGDVLFFKNVPENLPVTSVYYGNNVPKPARRGFKHLLPDGTTGTVVVRTRKVWPLISDDNPKAQDTVFWSALRTHRTLSDEGFDSIIGADRQPLYVDGTAYNVFKPTIIVLRIKATNQLNGMLDNFFCDAEMVVPANSNEDWRLWDTLPRTELIPSENPADAYRWLLQGPMNALALSNDRIDIDTLLEWRQKNIDEGWKISNFIETEGTLLKELNNVAFTGRAEYGFVDGKHSVVLKEKKILPVQLFTPKNSSGFTSTRGYPEDIDGIKITFNSELVDYERDEIIFNDPAKDPLKTANPSLRNGKFRSIDLWGVTNPDLAYRHGRFAYYEQALRREIYKFKTDIEGIRCSRGDMIRIQNDVINVGYGAGRIKAITANTITLDETVDTDIMVAPLGLQIRTPLGAIAAIPANYNGNGVWQCTPPEDCAVGDLVVYGQMGKVAFDAIVTELDYAENLVVNITATNAANEMYDFDGDPIPEYNSGVTELPDSTIPETPFLSSVSVDASNGAVFAVLEVPFNSRSQGLSHILQYRGYSDDGNPSEDWTIGAVATDTNINFTISNLARGGLYDFRVRTRSVNNLYSYWSNIINVVVDEGLAIDAATNLSVVHSASGTFLRWNSPQQPRRVLSEVHKLIQDPSDPFIIDLGDLTQASFVAQVPEQGINLGYINREAWFDVLSNETKHIYGVAERTTDGVYSNISTYAVEPPSIPVITSTQIDNINGLMRVVVESTSQYPLGYYEIRASMDENVNGDAADLIGKFEEGNASFTLPVNGIYYISIRAVDMGLNKSNYINLTQTYTALEVDVESILPDIVDAIEGNLNNLLDDKLGNYPTTSEVNNIIDSAIGDVAEGFDEDPRLPIVEIVNNIFDNYETEVQSLTGLLEEKIAREAAIVQINETVQTETQSLASQINVVSSNLSTETQQRTAAITQLNQTIVSETEARTNQVNTLTSNLSTETTQRTAAITQLNQTVATESETRATQFNQLSSDLSDETTQRSAQIGQLNTTIANESSVRATQINQVQASINTETTQRTAAITQVNQTIATESETRANQINTVQAAINTETQQRTAAITQVNSTIATESQVRADAVQSLTANINGVDVATNSKIDSVVGDVDGNSSAISALQGVVNNPTTGLSATFNLAQTANTTADGAADSVTLIQNQINNPTTGLAATAQLAQGAAQDASGALSASSGLTTEISGRVRALANNGGTFVLVGANTAARSGDNGTTWEEVSIPVGVYNDVFYLNTTQRFYAVGDGVLARSTDSNATAWEVIPLPLGVNNNYSSINYINGLFVLIGNNVCRTSPDLTANSFTFRTIPTGNYTKVSGNNTNAGSNTRLIIVGDGVAAYTTNGTSWTSSVIPAGLYKDVAFSGSLNWWCAVSNGAIAVSSNNGISWTRYVTGQQLNWRALIATSDRFWLVATDSFWYASPNTLGGNIGWTGGTGIAPVYASTQPFRGLYKDVAANGTNFVVVGTDRAATTTNNGSTWLARSLPPNITRISQAALLLDTTQDAAGNASSKAFLGVTNIVNGRAVINGIAIDGATNSLEFRADTLRLSDTNGTVQLYWNTAANKWTFTGDLEGASFTGGFVRTAPVTSPNTRVVINGQVGAAYPLWIGVGNSTSTNQDYQMRVDSNGSLQMRGSLVTDSGTGVRVDVGDDGTYLFWAGTGVKNDNGLYWVKKNGTFSSNVSRASNRGNFSTNQTYPINHKTVKGFCDLDVLLGEVRGTLQNVQSINNRQGTLTVRISDGTTVIYSKVIYLIIEGSPPNLIEFRSLGESYIFNTFRDNLSVNYNTNRTYTLSFTLDLSGIVYFQPHEPVGNVEGIFRSLEIRE